MRAGDSLPPNCTAAAAITLNNAINRRLRIRNSDPPAKVESSYVH